jgi:hypothetical protein
MRPLREARAAALCRSAGHAHRMSYDVFFCREQPELTLEPERMLRELEDTVALPGVVSLPLDSVKPEFRQQFPDISDGGNSLAWLRRGAYGRRASAWVRQAATWR